MDHSHHQTPPIANLTFSEKVSDAFSQYGFMPHGHCYLWKPWLVSAHVISDFLIGTAYVAISLILYGLVKKINLRFNQVVLCFGVFIGACGLTHFLEIWNLWHGDYWWAAWIKVLTAIASVGTGIYLFKLRHVIVNVAEAAKLAEQRRLDLELMTSNLEKVVQERTEELAVIADDLQHALKIRDEFISVASHELKTPLASMLLQTQIQEKLAENTTPSFTKYTAFMEKQVWHLTRLVDDMIDISRMRSGKLSLNLTKLDLNILAAEIFDKTRPQFTQRGYEAVDFTGQVSEGEFDAVRIEQVITNLLTNALKYGNNKPVELRVRSTPDNVIIEVEDHGIGVSVENQERIFERFERAIDHNEVSGFGLGLYICRQIVESHGGSIMLKSKLGEGSTFTVILPKGHA